MIPLVTNPPILKNWDYEIALCSFNFNLCFCILAISTPLLASSFYFYNCSTVCFASSILVRTSVDEIMPNMLSFSYTVMNYLGI